MNQAESMSNPCKFPAHQLWVELSTRATLRNLHFRSGKEEAALDSIVSIFELTRKLMKEHPEAAGFLLLAGELLEAIRPYTARWHALKDDNDRFIGPAQRLQFRTELASLQGKLREFDRSLLQLSGGRVPQQRVRAVHEFPSILGSAVAIGIDVSDAIATKAATPELLSPAEAFEKMNRIEREHIARRRGVDLGKLMDGTGLALSGGGIRSATFCLGVVQVLARANLLARFDYISTVSGGGYLGSFLANQFTKEQVAAEDFTDAFPPGSKDSPKVRHLRNSSKYLLPTSSFERLKLLGLLISGVLASTLLVAFIPTVCAALVHLFARVGGFEYTTHVADRQVGALWISAGAMGTAAIVCWLVRPITAAWRRARDQLDMFTTIVCVVAALTVAVATTPWLLALAHQIPNWQAWSASLGSIVTFLTGATVVKAMGLLWKYRRALSRLFIASGAVLFLILYLVIIDELGLQPIHGPMTTSEKSVLAALLLWLIWSASINLNLTGLHRYYRDALERCYLQAPKEDRGIPHPPLIDRLSARLPYYLINTTVNLTTRDNPELRGRGGDFFLLSKGVSGSISTGFRMTESVSKMNADLDLATAMAVSGAAASTNMGWKTLREYRALMAIFNVRLGYWLRWRSCAAGALASNAFVQLMRELTGNLNERASTLNLSDGGHIENLGAYELIRRKLKYIVCVDGGMDGAMTCSDLNRLQRLVNIDFGYHIEFDVADLQLIDNYSSNYGILVKIDYTPDLAQGCKQLGWMLYIKLAVVGTESNYVLDYRRENPLFPHQSTADQFFDEAQFEAYRKLGETAARSFLSETFGTAQVDGFEPWFERLARSLLRDIDPVHRREQASRSAI